MWTLGSHCLDQMSALLWCWSCHLSALYFSHVLNGGIRGTEAMGLLQEFNELIPMNVHSTLTCKCFCVCLEGDSMA